MSKWKKGAVYRCKCDRVIKEGKRKENGSPINQIMTVPHCYPSVVRSTLEVIAHSISEVGIIVHTVVNAMTATTLMRGGMHVDVTGGAKVTVIVTTGARVMANDTIVEAMRGTGDGVPLINIGEAMGTGQGNMDVWSMRGSGSRDRRELRTWSDMRTSGRGIAIAIAVSPFVTVVTSAMEGGPQRLRRVRCLWMRSGGTKGARVQGARGQGRGRGTSGE